MLGNHEPTLVLIVLIPPETGPNEKDDLHLLPTNTEENLHGEDTWEPGLPFTVPRNFQI